MLNLPLVGQLICTAGQWNLIYRVERRAPRDLPSTHTEAPLLTQRDGASCYCTILPISIHALNATMAKFGFSDTRGNGNHQQETFALSSLFESLYPHALLFSFILQSYILAIASDTWVGFSVNPTLVCMDCVGICMHWFVKSKKRKGVEGQMWVNFNVLIL